MNEKIINDFNGEYRFLSNFYACDFEFEGLTYHNAEAAFQAQKCASEEEKVKYTQVKSPVTAKHMGRREPGFPSNWNEICYGIMKRIVTAKFSNPELRAMLKATGTATLVEGNTWHDNRWGHCTCAKCATKEGQNWLGKILMEVRDSSDT